MPQTIEAYCSEKEHFQKPRIACSFLISKTQSEEKPKCIGRAISWFSYRSGSDRSFPQSTAEIGVVKRVEGCLKMRSSFPKMQGSFFPSKADLFSLFFPPFPMNL